MVMACMSIELLAVAVPFISTKYIQEILFSIFILGYFKIRFLFLLRIIVVYHIKVK